MERRRSRRFNVGWPIRIKGADSTGTKFETVGTLENLSSAGAYLHTRRQLPVGANIEVSIRVPVKKDHWMNYPAEIIRVDANKLDVGIAMRFRTLKPVFILG